MTMSMLLQARGIGKRFGGLQALNDISLDIERGEIRGLIGPNGAGKTTFFNVLTGLYRPTAGSIDFDGAPLNAGAPHEAAARGIARTFQNIRLFANMSAVENVMVGRHVRTRTGVIGAVLLTGLPEFIRFTVVPVQQMMFGKVIVDPEAIRMLVFGLALIVVMLVRPAGIWPSSIRKRELTSP